MARTVAKRGALIVFEGVDRVGKTTQCQRVCNDLKKEQYSVEYWKFPKRDTLVGRLIDEYLRGSCTLDDHVIHLLFSINRWETAKNLKEKLNSGTSLIIDRYAFSGVAYSAAKETLPLEWCKGPDSGLPKPDLVIYLSAKSENVHNRPGYGNEVYETDAFQEKVKKVFETLKDESWKVFEIDHRNDEVDQKILTTVKNAIRDSSCLDLKPLWSDHIHA